MFYKLRKLGNVRLFTLFYAFHNFRPYSVLAVIYFFQICHSYALALSIFSIAQISQGVFEIPLGYYSDKYGRSNCLRVGAVAGLLALVCYAYGGNYPMLVIGAILEGIGFAAFSGNNDALLYETLLSKNRKEEYHHEYGKMNSWLELSGFLGTFVGGMIAVGSLASLFKMAIIPHFVATMVSLGFVDPMVVKEKAKGMKLHLLDSWKIYKNKEKIRLLSIAEIIGYVGGVAWNMQSAFYNLFLPTWATSMMMSVNYFTSFVSFRLSGKLIQKYEAMRVLLYSEVYSRIVVLVAFFFPSVASPFMIAIASSTYGPSVVAKSTIMQNEFTNEQRATVTSINSFVGNIMYSGAAVVVGMMADRMGVARSLLIVQILMGSIAWVYYKLFRINMKQA